MKIAAMADVHSNVFALEAVVGDARARNADLMVNLGDVLYGPIAPRATYDFLEGHEFVTIKGNQDRLICEATAKEVGDNPTLNFVINDLGEEPSSWLQSLPADWQMDDEIYLCHGAPSNDMTYLLENIETGKAHPRPESEIIDLLKGNSSSIVICGHTHIPRTVALSSGQLVINPGSVGLPAYTDDEPIPHSMENFSPHASYALIEKGMFGWTVEQIKVPYDFKKAAQAAANRGREDWAHFLSTGRGL